MSFLTLLRPVLVFGAAVAALPVAAFAHPGHDGDHGGGLTWDFAGEVLHRLSSPYHLAPAVIAGGVAIFAWRKLRVKRARDEADK